jgi:ligand-binding SRPBCC domain-containing protein
MSQADPTLRTTSEVLAPADTVWNRVTSQEGINHEMGPYLKMTLPKEFRGKSIGDVSAGTHVGKSLLLLFKIIPVGYDDITIAQIEPGRMFREQSELTGMRTWIHHRNLEPLGEKTLVTDTITVVPRPPIPGLTRVVRVFLTAFFKHRHKRLREHFAPAATDTDGERFVLGRQLTIRRGVSTVFSDRFQRVFGWFLLMRGFPGMVQMRAKALIGASSGDAFWR